MYSTSAKKLQLIVIYNKNLVPRKLSCHLDYIFQIHAKSWIVSIFNTLVRYQNEFHIDLVICCC